MVSRPVHCSQSNCLDPCVFLTSPSDAADAWIDAVEIHETVVDDAWTDAAQNHRIVAGVDGCHDGPFGAMIGLKSRCDEACYLDLEDVAKSL